MESKTPSRSVSISWWVREKLPLKIELELLLLNSWVNTNPSIWFALKLNGKIPDGLGLNLNLISFKVTEANPEVYEPS